MSNQILQINSASFQDVVVSASLKAGPGIIVDFTAAAEVTGTFSGRGDSLINVSASYIMPTANTTAPKVYAGMTSYPIITDNIASSEIYVEAGTVNLYNNSYGEGLVTQYPITEATFSLVSGSSASVIYAISNGITASYIITDNDNITNGTSIVKVATVYRADYDAHVMQLNRNGLALANKLQNRLIDTEKFARVDGFTLSETGSGHFIVSAGSVWYGATKLSANKFDSRDSQSLVLSTGYDEVHFAQHSASQWVIPIVTNGTYNNQYYDDGNNLVAMSPLSYSANYFYRILGENSIDDEVFYIASSHQYPDLAGAVADVVPSNIPPVLNEVSILVGRIVFQQGSYASPLVESAFTTNFGQTLTTQHNSLIGLQGGIGGEYYHITNVDYIGNGTGTIVRTDNAIITNAHISGSLRGTSSWANNAITSSNSNTASIALTASWAPIPISASWASSSISSSFSTTASITNAISFIPITTISASWVSASVKITTADTASYINGNNVIGIVTSSSLTSTIFIPTTESNATYYVAIVPNSGSQQIFIDDTADNSSITFNPATDILTVPYISCSQITGSHYGTSSYALTASYVRNTVIAAISGSNFTHTGDQIAVTATPLSFTMQAGETWVCNAYLSTQSSNNRGMVYAISSSAGTMGDVEGWVMTELTSITTLSRQRLTAVNTKMATSVHTQANTPGPDQIQFCIVNPSVTTTISIAVAVSNNGDTVTVIQGSYIVAKKVEQAG